MKIALVYAHLNMTGSLPRQHVHLARYLVAAGHEVHTYSFAPESELNLAAGIHFHDVPAKPAASSRIGLALHVATFARNATRMIRRDRAAYDVVHSRGMSTWEQDIAHVTGVVSGEIERDRVVRTSSRLTTRAKDAALPIAAPIVLVRKSIERRIFEDRVPFEIHTSSRLVRDNLLAAYEVDPVRVRVVSPAVDIETFRPPASRLAARRTLGLPEADSLILFCGHSWVRKGLDRAVLALAKMREPAQIAVVGQGDPEPYLALARQLGVAERLHFLGPRTDTWRFFQAADVFLLPTRVDMWGMTVAEAMATAVPPITTTAAGAAELITDGENGFVFSEPLDVALVAATLDRLAADPALRHRLGRAARERSLGLTWDEYGRQVEASMVAVAERRRGGEGTYAKKRSQQAIPRSDDPAAPSGTDGSGEARRRHERRS